METPKGAYRWSRDNPVVIESSKIFDTLEKFSEVLTFRSKALRFFQMHEKIYGALPKP